MGVPVGPSARLERDAGPEDARGVGCREQRIDPYASGEVLGGSLPRWLRTVALDLHRTSFDPSTKIATAGNVA
jgi:hypothetical protein